MYFIKKFCILITLLFSITTYSQTVMNNTYLDVPLNQVNDFLELHKKVVDMSDGEQRTIDNHWVYRHWYGNDHSIMLGDLYSSAEAAVNDDFWGALRNNIDQLPENEKKEMQDIVAKWWGYWNNHTDEMRVVDWEKNWKGKETLDLDIPYVFVVGSYNSSAGNQEMIDAYMNWSVNPGVDKGVMLYGGGTSHFIGSGSDVQLWSAYTNIADFAEANGANSQRNADAAPSFWSLVEGAHSDQIYIHVGHTIDKKFNLAGADK